MTKKYYLDCEFLEGTQKEKFPISLFRKTTPPTIDLISIGIVSEDNREYYAISKDFNLKEAWNRYDIKTEKKLTDNSFGEDKIITKKVYWIRDNVLKPIWIDLFLQYESEYTFLKGKSYDAFEQQLKNGELNHYFTFKSFKALINRYGKTNKEIAEEIKFFTDPKLFLHNNAEPELEFYAYYADYDWVVFCWIFGKMMNLPNVFPMYCRDLKQTFDEKQQNWLLMSDEKRILHCVSLGLYSMEIDLKKLSNYPKQENEHSAIDDARWNKKLHEFLNTL